MKNAFEVLVLGCIICNGGGKFIYRREELALRKKTKH